VGDIREAFRTTQSPERLEVVRIGDKPMMLQIFTVDGDDGSFHWIDDPSVNSYVPCPGAACPLCYLSDPPKVFQLLPTLVVEKKAVGVLMVSMARGPYSLGPQLMPHLDDANAQDKLFLISRARDKYTVQVRALGDRADRCLSVIQGFAKTRDAGLNLLSAFPKLSAEQMAELPSVKARLDAMGGWAPPGS
jgi:hypothetical protein